MSAATPARALLALVVLVAGCAPPLPATSASPSPTAVPSGGVLRVVQAADLETLDPWASPDAATDLVLRQVYEPLVDLEPGALRVVPKLADRWSISGDGRTYTFTLRAGVRFHDGGVLDSSAVVSTFERGRSLGRLVALPIASVSAADASTVVFTLRTAYAPLLAALASPRYAIVSPACAAQDPSWTTAAFACDGGSGPFRLEPGAWRGGTVTLSRSATYWGRDADGHALPYLDAVTFQAIADDTARGGAVHAGTADVALDLSPAAVASVRSDPNIAVLRRPPSDVSFLGFTASGPFGSADVRKAVAMAIDRSSIVQTVFAGDAKVASQLLPPGIVGYDSTIVEFAKYDTTTAKSLLAGAGQASGFATELWYPAVSSVTLPDTKRIAQSIVADLAKVGVTATLRAYGDEGPNGAMPMWIQPHPGTRADPDGFLSTVTGDPVVQALLDRARAETDESKRAELYKQVTKLLQQQTARVPLWSASVPIVANKKVRALVPQPIVGESFAGVWLGR